jgi:hypothetical protein
MSGGEGFACTALPPDERSHRVREIDAWHMHLDFYFEGNIHGVLGLGGGVKIFRCLHPSIPKVTWQILPDASRTITR